MDGNPVKTDIAQLVAEHHQAVYGYAYRLTGSAADAEDLTQQVFLKAQEKLHQLRRPQSARSWLFTILRNCFVKGRQKRSAIPATSLSLDVESVPADIPDQMVVDREQLQAALNQLPQKYRLVLTMFYYEDCSYREIAASLEIPIGTVMSRLARAKGYLRSKLLDPVAQGAAGREPTTASQRG